MSNIKKIDTTAVLDLFYEKGIKPTKWCHELRVIPRSFYMIINNEFGKKRLGTVSRRVRSALERDGLMVYLEDDAADVVDQAV